MELAVALTTPLGSTGDARNLAKKNREEKDVSSLEEPSRSGEQQKRTDAFLVV